MNIWELEELDLGLEMEEEEEEEEGEEKEKETAEKQILFGFLSMVKTLQQKWKISHPISFLTSMD